MIGCRSAVICPTRRLLRDRVDGNGGRDKIGLGKAEFLLIWQNFHKILLWSCRLCRGVSRSTLMKGTALYEYPMGGVVDGENVMPYSLARCSANCSLALPD